MRFINAADVFGSSGPRRPPRVLSHYHRTFGLTRMALKTQEREPWVPVEAGAENREGGVACRTGYGMATIR